MTAPPRQSKCTLEPVIQPNCEAQSLAGRYRLCDVEPETSPIDAEPGVDQPARRRRKVGGRQMPQTVSHQPRLSCVREDDEIDAFEPER